MSNRLTQVWAVVSHVAHSSTHLPRLHFLGGIRSQQTNGQIRRFGRSKPAFVVLLGEDYRHPVMELGSAWRIQQFIGFCRDDCARLQDFARDLVGPKSPEAPATERTEKRPGCEGRIVYPSLPWLLRLCYGTSVPVTKTAVADGWNSQVLPSPLMYPFR